MKHSLKKEDSKDRHGQRHAHHAAKEVLAHELNDKLGTGPETLPYYQYCAAGYDDHFLRRTLEYVMSIPDEKIRKSRGALFNSLVKSSGSVMKKPGWQIPGSTKRA